MQKNWIGSTTLRLVLLTPALLLTACEAGKPNPIPSNDVIVMIDRSLSFHSRQQDAIDRSVKYLSEISDRKLGRWQKNSYTITVISLDAMPTVLWEGSLHDLQKVSKDDWTKQFAARSDFESCTDVTAAFTLAAERFARANAGLTSKYLLVFSDLKDEPPQASASSCAKPHFGPTEDFPWASLEDVSVNVFWLPINQKLMWQRAVNAQGLASHVVLYSDSESSAVTLASPPPAERKMSEGERVQEAGHFSSIFKNFLSIVFSLAALLAFALGGMVLYSRRNRSAQILVPSRRPPLSPEQLRSRNGTSPARRG